MTGRDAAIFIMPLSHFHWILHGASAPICGRDRELSRDNGEALPYIALCIHLRVIRSSIPMEMDHFLADWDVACS
jgi:hypothetical protein